ncbi:MAG: ABC transporter ATP-binding protein [Acholeplasmataceae bacterium]
MIELVSYLQSPFSGLSLLYPKYQNTLASLDRLNNIQALPLEDQTPITIHDFKTLLLKDVSFSYQQEKVLSNINMTINKNQIVLIKGASGAGKTTLFKLLLGFIKPQSGSITINDKNGTFLISENTRSLFSYVPQDHMILSGTIKENLNLFCEHSDELLYQVLKDVALDDVISKHPLKLNMMLQEKGKGLSEGQVQRLAIARALLENAPVLLLDEITSSLDKDTEEKLIEHLKHLKNHTIIMISHHDLPNELFDQIITI